MAGKCSHGSIENKRYAVELHDLAETVLRARRKGGYDQRLLRAYIKAVEAGKELRKAAELYKDAGLPWPSPRPACTDGAPEPPSTPGSSALDLALVPMVESEPDGTGWLEKELTE
eukprot:7298918-Karenia_brevis.AAC.1